MIKIPTVAIDAESRSLAITKPDSTPTSVATKTPHNIAIGNANDASCNTTGSDDSEVCLTIGVIDRIPVV
jgi:hypothetical protein